MQISKSTRILLAFASVYVFWGSTYLAIHVAGEHMSAPVVSGTRSMVSCMLIAAILLGRRRSLRVPRGEAWKLALVGLLFMSGNNMLLTWGEQMVPSGFASLIVSTMPIMIAVIEAVLPDGEALNKRGWAGTLLGTAGIVLLVWPSLHGAAHGAVHAGAVQAGAVQAGAVHSGAAQGMRAGFSRPLLGTVVLLGAALSFAVGSCLSRRFRFQADTFVATGWQVGTAAVFNLTVAAGTGGFAASRWTMRGTAAIVYLSIFGTLFGLVAFTYLLQNVAVTKVSTYAFVNPAIAVLLGALVLHERLVRAEFAGMAVIVCAVAMVVYSRVGRAREDVAEAKEAV